ncbi:hypothetical protein GCM10025788_02280 [Serinicoccus chungangensis]
MNVSHPPAQADRSRTDRRIADGIVAANLPSTKERSVAISPPPPDGETAESGLDERLDNVLTASRSSRWHASATRWQAAREVAAINYLQATLGTERFLPPIGGWAIDYTVAAAILDIIRRHGRPAYVLELGSGSGTPWFAAMAAQAGGHLVSVEHDTDHVDRTQSLLDHYDFQGVCTLVHAPLIPGADGASWYDPDPILSAVGHHKVDVLVVDGPPARSGPNARRPALQHLAPLLAPDALVVLDDVVRQEEQQVLTDWQHAFGERLQMLPIVDRASIFRLLPTDKESSR